MIKSLSNSILSVFIGTFMGIIGIALFGYSVYFIFFLSTKTELLTILPKENFEFFAYKNSEDIKIPNSISKISFFPKETGTAIVSYLDPENKKSHIIKIYENTKKSKVLKKQDCITYNHYIFCSSLESKEVLYKTKELMENKSSNLQSFEFVENKIKYDNSNFYFLGKTDFLLKNKELLQSFIQDENIKINEKLTNSIKNTIPYFSGYINLENNIYFLQLHKANNKLIFSKGLKDHEINTDLINKKVLSYVYVRKLNHIIDFIKKENNTEFLPDLVNFINSIKDKSNEIFENNASWKEDVLPLLSSDILINKYENGSSIFFSLPSEGITNFFYEKFKDIFVKIASTKKPVKKNFILEDGSAIYELFPSNKEVSIDNGKKDDVQYSFIKVENPDENNFFTALFTKKTILGFNNISDNPLSVLKKTSKLESSFNFPINNSVFFSYGSKDLEKYSIKKIEITAKEKEKNINIVGNILFTK
jgi:hypothetical protein